MNRRQGSPQDAPPPQRAAIVRSPSEWHERLKMELIAEGMPHDKASLISLKVLSALLPQSRKLEIVDDALGE